MSLLAMEIVGITLEDNLQEGQAEAEEHPDLNHLDTA
jgi:hypothetical protein